jgi:hypothetical protein
MLSSLYNLLRFRDFSASEKKDSSDVASEWLETAMGDLAVDPKIEKLPDGSARVWYLDGRKIKVSPRDSAA